MSHTSQRWILTSLLLYVFLCSLLATTFSDLVFASDVSCHFKAATETTEIHVLANGKTVWEGSIEKLQTKAIPIPEGPFTVISKVYNQNLKMKEDIRTEMHTRQCQEHAALSVPLFQDPKER